jgi:hypothetical protein
MANIDRQAQDDGEQRRLFDRYFGIVPWHELPRAARAFEVGFDAGRWSRFVHERVAHLEHVTLDSKQVPTMAEGTSDFGFSLENLQQVRDTEAVLTACVRALKRDAPFLLHLPYRFDNRPGWYKTLWQLSDLGRRRISASPPERQRRVTDLIAASVYFPVARTTRALERLGVDVSTVPLSDYRQSSFSTMRADALRRFSTTLEQRFTRNEMERVMRNAGLTKIRFSESVPYWCAIGYRE